MTGTNSPTDKCLLHIPHGDVGKELVRKVEVDTNPTLKKVGLAIDANFTEIERWVDRFYKECMCDCAQGGGGGGT